jgi:ABC-type Mn2+/Zn2+ transport system ATPase subunit
MNTMLEAKSLVSYGKLMAEDVSFSIEGKVVTVIGPNGAGKTLLKARSGIALPGSSWRRQCYHGSGIEGRARHCPGA